jgi:hypothetical protein
MLKTGIVFGFLLCILYSHPHHTLTLAFLLRMSSAGGVDSPRIQLHFKNPRLVGATCRDDVWPGVCFL